MISWDIKHRRELEFAAVGLVLVSAMLDPLLTFGLAVALIAAAVVLLYLAAGGHRSA